MTVELSREEAEILIAVLTFAEGAALVENPSMVNALEALRPWRSALLRAHLASMVGSHGNRVLSETSGSARSEAQKSFSSNDISGRAEGRGAERG